MEVYTLKFRCENINCNKEERSGFYLPEGWIKWNGDYYLCKNCATYSIICEKKPNNPERVKE